MPRPSFRAALGQRNGCFRVWNYFGGPGWAPFPERGCRRLKHVQRVDVDSQGYPGRHLLLQERQALQETS